MNQIKQIENLTTILLFLGLTLSVCFLYFAQERLFVNITTGVNLLGPEKYLRIFSVIAIFFTSIISLFLSKSKYHFSIYIAYLTLLFYISLNFIFSVPKIENVADFFTYFMDKKGIGTWLCLGLIFVSYNDKRYKLFNHFLVATAIYISILTFYNFYDFGVGLWRSQALSKYRVYAVNMIWIAPYVFLILKPLKKFGFLRLFILLVGILLALVIQTRSFLIIYIITIAYDFFNTKNKRAYVIFLVLSSLGFLFLVLNTEILSASLDLLINRGTNDTRSEQLAIFLNQLSFLEIITGGGFNISYKLGYTETYAVDNQWLYLLWWGGIIPVITYSYLCAVIPIKMLLKGGLNYNTKVECFVLILWFLALTGLAIFTTMTIDLFFFTTTIILGRVLYKYSKTK